jgi:hypothetical protein
MWSWLKETQWRLNLTGKTVIKFESQGCMAHVHNFQWVGYIVSVDKGKNGYYWAKIKIMKEGTDGIDCRDFEHDKYVTELATMEHMQRLNPFSEIMSIVS